MNVRALIAEALGTFILVGLGSMSITAAQIQGLPPLLTVPFGFGLALMAGVALFGHISGAYFNPAVTVAAWIDQRIDWMSAVAYVAVQIIGALAASLMILLLVSKDAVTATLNQPAAPTTSNPTGLAVSDIHAFIIELILTTVFVAVILAITNKEPQLAVLVIPLTLALIHFVGVPLTGASVNPARSLAPAIVSGNYSHLWVYLTAPFAGSILGWLIYRFVSLPEDDLSVEMELDGDEFEDLEDDDPALTAG
jgi:aquaporin Z